MRRLLWLLPIVAGCVPYPVGYRVQEAGPAGVTTEEVLRLTQAGIAESVVIEKINADGVSARPTADQIAGLKKQGVSDPVLAALNSARVATPRSSVVYYYDYPGYAYPYYYPYYGYYGAHWGWGYGYPYHYHGYYRPTYAYSVSRYR